MASKVYNNTIEDSKEVNGDKLICGRTARKYLNCSKAEFESLVEQGVIQAYRDEYKRWKVSKKSVLDYVKRSQASGETRLITNENHYQEVIEKICEAETSIKIMTADFNFFRLKPTNSQGIRTKDGTPFINHLMDKAKEGVRVHIILSNPSANVDAELKNCYRQMISYPFATRNCIRNHAKVVIIDDKTAYIGSANMTKAGLGQETSRNFEVGILTENPELVSSAKDFFSMIWDGDRCDDCYRAEKCVEY